MTFETYLSLMNAGEYQSVIEQVDIATIASLSESEFVSSCLVVALSHQGLGQNDQAIQLIRLSLKKYPRNTTLLYNLAVILQTAGSTLEARALYLECVSVDPHHLDALWNGGELFRLSQDFSIAFEWLSRYERLGEYRFGLYHRLAVCLWHLNRLDEADTYFNRALTQDFSPITRWEYALFLISRKEYKRGFENYAGRFEEGHKINVILTSFGYPRWNGNWAELKGQALFILPEQGLGDQVQFMACLPEFLERAQEVGARIVLVLRDTLFELVKNSFSDREIRFYPHEIGRNNQAIVMEYPNALEMAIGDLPKTIGLVQPIPKKYLSAPVGSTEQAQEWLEINTKNKSTAETQAQDKKIRIGISWSTNGAAPSFARTQRNVPVEVFKQFRHLPEQLFKRIEFISLVVGPSAGEVSALHELGVKHFSHLIEDYADTAGLIECCDLVISPCTSLAHVAAAMGKEVLLLLQEFGDWRWGNFTERSDWYTNLHIFQQDHDKNWVKVIAQVAEYLERRLAS